MQDFTVGIRGARLTHATTVVLAATLVALTAVLVLARSSEAQDVPPVTLTVDQTEVGFGAVLVDGIGGSLATRTITVTNTGGTPIIIGGATFTSSAGEVLNLSTDIDPVNGLTVASDGTATFKVTFDPNTVGSGEAVLTLTEKVLDGGVADTIGLVNEAGNTVTGVDVSGTGTQDNPFAQPGAKGCTIVGTNNGEALTGTGARDVICALGGRDRVSALAGNDKVKGGKGNDIVRSSKGRDTLLGGAGGDRLTDKAGKRGDRLYGQGGVDTLIARDGKRGDLLVGGPRRDKALKDRGDTARSI